MNYTIFIILFVLLSAVYLYLGYLSSKKVKTQSDFFLAGRGLTLWPLSLTLIATQLGGGAILGVSDAAYQYGIYGVFYTLGICLGFAALAMGAASKLRSFNVGTTAQLFEKLYGSPFLRKVASILSILSMFGIFLGQVVASRKFMLGIGVESEFIFFVFWGVVIAYTVLGGLKAVVSTDVFQVIFILIVFTAIFLFVMAQDAFVPTNFFQMFSLRAGSDLSELNYTGLLLLPFLFSFLEQDLAQRFFAAKDQRTARVSAGISSIILLVFALIPVYFGVTARDFGAIDSSRSVLMVFMEHTVGTIAVAFVACGLLAAIISTADSLLCAISSNMTLDFEGRFFKKDRLLLSKIVTCIVGVGTLFLGRYFDNILSILIQSYEFPICALFVSVIACFFVKRGLCKEAAGVSIFAGLGACFYFHLYPTVFPREILSLLISLMGYGVGMLWNRRKG
ncbi:MAG: sodium:solute symporter family protein [Alphaproteobacteria bacterium]|nr:sodium:solute symporter family protein [Alphaproteobacteria bacterium]MBT5389924.1 sodium:solute symporter family protein [Alphaproteobacteria bacterium]